MKPKHCILFCLEIILFQACYTQCCEIPKESSGIISFSIRGAKDFTKCWYINAPKDSYTKLDLLEYQLSDPYCDYMYLEVQEDNSGEKYKICQYYRNDNWTRTMYGGVTINLIIRNSWGDSASFKLQYYTESVVCLQNDHFRCSENQCIRSEQVCDGIEDCENGSDEEECGLLPIKGISVSRKNSIDWLKNRQTDFGWGRNTHRAITALYLTGDAKFQGSNFEEEAMVKELELKMATSLLRNSSDPLSVNELSMYVNALLVTCHNYQDFIGNDLLKKLGNRAFSSSQLSPGAFLTLCNANWTFSEANVRQVLSLLSKEREYPFAFEIQAMTVMALSCIQKKTNLFYNIDNATDIYNETLQNFMLRQNPDGSFGNVHTTAMVTQALFSSGQMKNGMWNFENAIRFLMQSLNSTSVDFLSVYLSLPLFKGKTLVDIGSVDCSKHRRRNGEDEDITDVMDKLGGNTRVQYSLYIGDYKNVIHTMYLRVPENSTAFDVMKIAQIADLKYKFSYHKTRDQVYIYEIAGITNDMEAGKFWLLFTTDSNQKTKLSQCTTSPNEVIVGNNEHLVLWYKTVDI